MIGVQLTNWSVRLALLCYAAVLFGNITASCCQKWPSVARWLWTIGCFLLLAHVALAFHFFHQWQHAQAVAETARRTATQFGWEFGGGVYFNYVFALVWMGDVLWWWAASVSYSRRSVFVAGAIHTYLFFIVVNGAIVFEDGPSRWVGLLILLLLLSLGVNRMMQRVEFDPSPRGPE